MSAFAFWMKFHQDLPPHVHPYPTVLGKKRFEILQTFNWVLAAYISIHKLFMPAIIMLLQTETSATTSQRIGIWYLYHVAIGLMMSQRGRNPRHAYWIVYLSWFALGFLPLTLVQSFVYEGTLQVRWETISGILCYGSSLMMTLFLLYRMRMPTTAYLFGLENRIVPKLRYAIPYFLIGLLVSLLRFRLLIA